MMILGVVLIVSALLLLSSNRQEDEEAGQEAEILMSYLESWMQERERLHDAEGVSVEEGNSAAEDIAEEESVDSSAKKETIDINGYEYIGYVEIPALELKLPVLSEWDYALLKFAPCRQHGSSETDDLVIAAHNYTTHFGRLNELTIGDALTFTDVDGTVNTYSVVKIDTVDPDAVDYVLNSEHALVLYTCTVSGKNRVAVFCDREVEKK